MQACWLGVALLGARQKECVCVPLSDHRSSACMCVHVREHTCDVNKASLYAARSSSILFACVAM